MKNTKAFILVSAALWVGLKLYFFMTGRQTEGLSYAVLLNMLLLLAIVFIAIYLRHKNAEEENHFLDDVRAGMKAGGYYIILIGLFSYVYYQYIDPAFLLDRIDERMMLEQTRVNEHWAEMQAGEPSLQGMEPQSYLELASAKAHKLMSPHFMVIGGTLLLLISTIFYALASTLLLRKVWFNQ